ncbi:MAG TPA: helix-turn-helix transcriptional regulator [Ruminococcus flavefaciens]|nr:helix-turn-helix transcriptional regulator [Ruminococcus flavefaciens]HQM02798.1 helix-turn-helix transcriptional regulator [Ruminococcus flavefaciens]
MNSKTDLGQFISEHRKIKKLQSQELAEILGITVAYYSQIEHGKRKCPDLQLIKKMIEVFELTMEETNIFYDLYAEASGQLSPDITEYLQSNKSAVKAIRAARDASATDKDWERFIKYLRQNEQ